MQTYGQDCRIIETVSVVENKFENGCSITMDTLEDYKKNGNYNCAYIKIDGGFSRCINNYIAD